MKITILAAGSRGDVQPYIALGVALKNAGCAVRIATFSVFRQLITQSGLEFFPVRGDVTRITAGAAGKAAVKADNPLKILLSFNQLKSLAYDLQEDFYNACLGVDAIVYHPGASIGFFAAQELGIPAIFAPYLPMTPTTEFSSLIFYGKPNLGKSFNKFTFTILEQIFWFASAGNMKQYWQEKFHRLPDNFGCPFPRQHTRRQPTITACSNFVFPRPHDWPEHVYNTGFWFLEEEKGWTPPPDLLDFLAAGDAPVYVGFGSIGNPEQAQQTTSLVIDAVRRAGKRGVLATGWNAMSNMDAPPQEIYMLESAPHAWLFPRMAAVVHHGGAGTTAAGLRSGVPSIIISHGNDTPGWGQRVYDLGVGPKPIPRKKLTVETLALAIQTAGRKEIHAAAKALGEQIQTEHGTETAAQIIINSVNSA